MVNHPLNPSLSKEGESSATIQRFAKGKASFPSLDKEGRKGWLKRIFFAFALLFAGMHFTLPAQSQSTELKVDVHKALAALEQDEDTDGDKRITVNDAHVPGTDR